MRKILIILSLALPLAALSQEDRGKFSRFNFDFKAGTAIPLGPYSNSSTSQLVRENPFDPNRQVIGVFTKDGNGFAEPGFFYEGSIIYSFGKRWFIGFLGQKFSNPVNLIPVNFLLKEIVPEFNMSQGDYQGTLLGPMIGFSKTSGLLRYSISQAFGSSKLDFPIFKMGYGENVPWVFTHFYDYEPIKSLFSKTEFKLDYQILPWIKLGGNLSFIYSDFDYSLTLSNVPGGSGFYQFDDTVNLRLLNLGLHMGIEF